MPLYKYVANRALTLAENILLGQKLSEYHTGYRAWSRRVLQTLPMDRCSDDFVFDNQSSFRPSTWISSRRDLVPDPLFPGSVVDESARSVVYGFGVLEAAARYRLHRLGLLNCSLIAPDEFSAMRPSLRILAVLILAFSLAWLATGLMGSGGSTAVRFAERGGAGAGAPIRDHELAQSRGP